MAFNAEFNESCRGLACRQSGTPKNIKEAFPLARFYHLCNSCFKKERSTEQRGTTVESLIAKGEQPMRPVLLYDYKRGDHDATPSGDL